MEKPVAKRHFVPKLILSIFLIALLSSITIFLFYPSKNGLGGNFDIFMIYMFTRQFGLWFASLMIILRLVSNKLVQSFGYVFCAVLNCSIGLLALFLFAFHHYNQHWLHLCLLNLLLGSAMLSDCLVVYLRT